MPGEEFDDDFEVRIPLLDKFDLPEAPPVPAGGSNAQQSMPPAQMEMMQQMMQQMSGGRPGAQPARQYPSDVVMDGEEDGPHKHWTTVYPIYVDAKRRYRHGCRRVAYEKAVLFPNSLYLANAAKRLELEYKHEVCLLGSQCSRTARTRKTGRTPGASRCASLGPMAARCTRIYLRVRMAH